jgi:Protein of unknown function (DUF2911)
VHTIKPVFGHEIPYNKLWAPGGKPMTMFLNHEVTLDGKDMPVGAYTMFVIPTPNKWTRIVSRSTDTSGKYDENKDLLRAPMQWGELSSPESAFSIYFAQTAPGQCTRRVDLEKSRAWGGLQEKIGFVRYAEKTRPSGAWTGHPRARAEVFLNLLNSVQDISSASN